MLGHRDIRDLVENPECVGRLGLPVLRVPRELPVPWVRRVSRDLQGHRGSRALVEKPGHRERRALLGQLVLKDLLDEV